MYDPGCSLCVLNADKSIKSREMGWSNEAALLFFWTERFGFSSFLYFFFRLAVYLPSYKRGSQHEIQQGHVQQVDNCKDYMLPGEYWWSVRSHPPPSPHTIASSHSLFLAHSLPNTRAPHFLRCKLVCVFLCNAMYSHLSQQTHLYNSHPVCFFFLHTFLTHYHHHSFT